MKAVYYNENDPFAAAWLRQLIAAGLIPDGDVDERSIVDINGGDLAGYEQCHFFAGIGGWAYALGLAGWHGPVWTGSCPCQPFSGAGKQRGTADERHLWPEFFRLVAQRRPPVVFGEQVASKLGREWLAGIRADLETLDYAVGAADLCAAGVGAPHIRQRLYWLADAERNTRDARRSTNEPRESIGAPPAGPCSQSRRRSDAGGLSIAERGERQWLAAADSGNNNRQAAGRQQSDSEFEPCGDGGMGNNNNPRPQGRREHAGECRDQLSPWAAGVFIPCLDGKARRVEPSIQPLAHGFPNRVGVLRGSGNAIVPQVAQAFITAYMETAA